jgi:hypothetical protein
LLITARHLAFIGDENAGCAPACSARSNTMERRHFKQTQTLGQRLADEVKRLREEARSLPPGRRREILLRRVRQDEAAIQIDAWISSPGLRAPI